MGVSGECFLDRDKVGSSENLDLDREKGVDRNKKLKSESAKAWKVTVKKVAEIKEKRPTKIKSFISTLKSNTDILKIDKACILI